MAILFNCPYCTAQIKVPDAVAGKIGRCPKCETKVRVPAPKPPPVQKSEDETPAPVTAASQLDSAAFPEGFDPDDSPSINTQIAPSDEAAIPSPDDFPAINVDNDLPVVSDEQGTPTATPSYAARLKKQKTGWSSLIIPLVLGMVLVAIVLGYQWYTQTTFTGELTAEIVEPFDLETTYSRTRFNLPGNRLERMLADFRDDPQVLTKGAFGLMYGKVRYSGNEQGLVVTLQPGPDVRVVRINPFDDPDLATFLKEKNNRALLERPRSAVVGAALQAFARDWDTIDRKSMKMGNLAEYQEPLARSGMAGELGYHVAASFGDDLFPCSYSDSEGRMYFLLPKNIETFRLIEPATMEGEDSVFPAPFGYTVTLKSAQPEEAEPVTPEPEPAETDPAETDPLDTELETPADGDENTDESMEKMDVPAMEKPAAMDAK